jgi:LysR family glycine cleavage system transcriptional activator
MFRFFEAAARHLNFTRAAGELHVTHGAVSQRIKRLEEHLRTPLFRRSGRSMLLTDEGSHLLERVRSAMSEIAAGVEAIRPNNGERILTISSVPCFAAYWLLPRLADFNERHPDIQVNIRATRSLTDFNRDGVDMAVRFGPGTWEGLRSIKLYDEQLIPVCSPALRGGRLPRVPSDLLKVPLLHHDRQPWSIWFEAVGLDYRDVDQGPHYSDQSLLFPAAIAGLGVALVRASLVEADLKSGRLVRLFSRSVPTKYSYFIVYPPDSQNRGKILTFQQWLLEQVQSAERKGALGTEADHDVSGHPPVRRREFAGA